MGLGRRLGIAGRRGRGFEGLRWSREMGGRWEVLFIPSPFLLMDGVNGWVGDWSLACMEVFGQGFPHARINLIEWID